MRYVSFVFAYSYEHQRYHLSVGLATQLDYVFSYTLAYQYRRVELQCSMVDYTTIRTNCKCAYNR